MKKLIIKAFSLMLVTFFVCSFVSQKTTNVKSGDPDDDQIVLVQGQTADASDGTHIGPQSTDVMVYICPGSGAACKGTYTINGQSGSYNGSKGVNEPDIKLVY